MIFIKLHRKNAFWLILKNSSRNAFKNKAQFIGLSVLVALLAMVLSLLTSINARVLRSNADLKNDSNLHQVVLQMDPGQRIPNLEVNYKISQDFDKLSAASPEALVPTNTVAAQQYMLDILQQRYEGTDLAFDWSRTEGRDFNAVKSHGNLVTTKVLAKTSDGGASDPVAVDKLVIFEGQDLKDDTDIVVDNVFAEKNNLKIGDIIRIQTDNYGSQLQVDSPLNKNEAVAKDIEHFLDVDIKQIREEGLSEPNGLYERVYSSVYHWYQICGFGGSADFTMPVVSASLPIPNRQKEGLFYVKPEVFDLHSQEYNDSASATVLSPSTQKKYELWVWDSTGTRLVTSSASDKESFYSLAMKNHRVPKANLMAQMNKDWIELIGGISSNPITYFYALGDKNYRFSSRTDMISDVINLYNIASSVLVIVLAMVVFYTLGLIIRKQIEAARGQIGILKALGYSDVLITFNFMMTPFLSSIIGGVVGFAIGGGVSTILVKQFKDFFVLNYGESFFSWPWFALTVFGLWIVLTALSVLVTLIVLRQSTVDLIQGQHKTKISRFDMLIKDKYSGRAMGQKVRMALFIDAKGKMSVVGTVALLASMLFTISFAAPNILKRNQDASFEGLNYKQVVEYNEPAYNNPLSFYKTFNDDVYQGAFEKTFVRSDALKKFVALPTDSSGNYDINAITKDYLDNQLSGNYYSLTPGAESQEGTFPEYVPNLINTNLKFLSGQNIASSTNYYRFMSKFGILGDGFTTPILLTQWPDYVTLNNQLSSAPDDNNKDQLINDFKAFQHFYSRLAGSIALSITNDYYDTSKEKWYDESDDDKINSFNDGWTGVSSSQNFQNVFSKTSNAMKKWKRLFGLVGTDLTDNYSFGLTTTSFGVGSFKMLPIDKVIKPGEEASYLSDEYLAINPDSIDVNSEKFKKIMTNFVLWYGALFNLRPDQGIIQAAYLRPPYFVQQNLKEAYLQSETYNQSFSVVSYNSDIEQLGTYARVKDNRGHQFKIYGTEKDNHFLDLRDKKNNNLLDNLYQKNLDKDIHNLVINKTIAKKLNLKKGNKISLDVLQNELQYKNSQGEFNAAKLDDWSLTGKKGTQRSGAMAGSTYTPLTDFDHHTTGIVSLNVNGQSLDVYPSNLTGTSPSKLYQAVLDNNVVNRDKSTKTLFEIVGIQEGYGDEKAWMQEKEIESLLSYDKVNDLNWQTYFAWQWWDTFAQDWMMGGSNMSGIEDLTMQPAGTDNKYQSWKISYQDFLNQYVNNPSFAIANPDQYNSALAINKIFKNSFPLFNYKYSNKEDVGDLAKLVTTYQPYGDYSPVAMQGFTADPNSTKKSFDGMGEGSMRSVLPLATARAILEQISNLVLIVLILLIAIIILITYVIMLLTTSLIIEDNSRFIAVMKVLGYSNGYIAKTVLGMYFIMIALVYAIGFVAGWFIFQAIINAMTSTIVLPLHFEVWLPFAVAAGIIGLYSITIVIGFRSISKNNPIAKLQSNSF